MTDTPDDLDHDVDGGTLNGRAFTEFEDIFTIPSWPCETCGVAVWVGTITSSCGDTQRDVWVYNSPRDCFSNHRCGQPVPPARPECEVCYPLEDDAWMIYDESEGLRVATA